MQTGEQAAGSAASAAAGAGATAMVLLQQAQYGGVDSRLGIYSPGEVNVFVARLQLRSNKKPTGSRGGGAPVLIAGEPGWQGAWRSWMPR